MGGLGQAGGDVEAVEAVPEILRAEALAGKAPQRAQDGALIPVGDGGFGPGGTNAVDRGEQQVVGRGGSGAGLGPELEQGLKGPAAAGGLPEGAGQAKCEGGGLERDGGGFVLDEFFEALGGAEIGLLDHAGVAIDAASGDGIVVGLVALLFADEGRHIG